MFSGFNLIKQSDSVKIYEYKKGVNAIDSVRYELWAYDNGTYMLIRFDRSKPIKTYAGIDLELFNPEEHIQ